MERIIKRVVISIALALGFAFGLDMRVGSENAYKPFAYLNEKGEASGFDNDVLRLLASYIPEASLSFTSIPWNAIFSGLDSKKFDIVANQITKTKEREAKYIFSKQPYFYDISTLISLENSHIKDIAELNGGKIGVSVGSNHAKNLEDYLKSHPELNIEVVYYKTSPTLVADLKAKKIAAMVNNPIAARDYANAQNITLDVSEFYFEKVPVYLLFRKDSKGLAERLDEALDKALKEGKIRSLVVQYFGEEYAVFLTKEKK
ncbi:substrate-binding periplasmic protein [Helicobacter marmotae]|uniref:L-cystine-binding protein tcyA n=1 Tax=Helicobacter marmotae TaxID=152490 RepID=A0A3D8I5C0_9HELI|nr:transporter substrate-binding domain-containing protein [Helicobacter marmotae]RDU60342.1 L-cystine-binding protein tcyA [Helicobacter marmotae]